MDKIRKEQGREHYATKSLLTWLWKSSPSSVFEKYVAAHTL
jgi:hypothetical protein